MNLVFDVVQVLMIHFYCVFSKGILIFLYRIYEDLNYKCTSRGYLHLQTVLLAFKAYP